MLIRCLLILSILISSILASADFSNTRVSKIEIIYTHDDHHEHSDHDHHESDSDHSPHTHEIVISMATLYLHELKNNFSFSLNHPLQFGVSLPQSKPMNHFLSSIFRPPIVS